MSFDREHKQFERDAHETSHKHQMILGIWLELSRYIRCMIVESILSAA